MISFVGSFITIKKGGDYKRISCPPAGGRVATAGMGYPVVVHRQHLKIATEWERLDSGLVEVFTWVDMLPKEPMSLTLIEYVKGEV